MHARSAVRCATSVILLGIGIVGCSASVVSPQAMVPVASLLRDRHDVAIAVEVTGGQKANALGVAQIPSEDFRTALVEGIRKSGVFASVVEGNATPYRLHVHMLKLDQPFIGSDFTVRMETAWQLFRAGSSEAIFQEPVTSSHTATGADAFSAARRLVLANEGAARENIRLGIEWLSRVRLE